MMYGIRNKVQLIGNLGKEPETGSTEKGKKYARFSIATNEAYRGANGEKIVATSWHNLVAWGKLAETVEKYLTKGKEVAICGKLVYRNYIDKNGVKRFITEVHVSDLLMLGSKNHE
jgi:single-strand DNA-binding protein